ncbi:MAG: proprotein convertase P-domain-containing protein [Saprospiraceae bacterium]|nr:proprotein convertase P-domain-containing protein [Saprospiraceae bacterium]
MLKPTMLLLFCLTVWSTKAQKTNGPASYLNPIADVEQAIMPKQNNKELLEAEMNQRAPGIAPHFAQNIQVFITPETHGTWEVTQEDMAVWRLRIYSKEAKSINLGFTKYVMPNGGKLFLYTPDYSEVQGPFTPADNEEHEELWTPIIPGDELVIEVQLPVEQMENLQLELEYVNHDFIGFLDMSTVLSGSCNLDVICGEADGWPLVEDYRDIIQSVAVISTGGSTFCTGFLVNNAAQDCTPYFMTAYHCNITSGNDQSLVAYWNYQNSFCRQPNSPQSGQPGNGTLSDFNTGSVLRAAYQSSDFTLVEFDDPVSETANAFFAGWSAEDVAPTSAITVHHPSGDEKRISFENDPTTLTAYLGDTPSSNYSHIRINDWDIGTTEPGSSGSPLFDQNKRIVGQLHGGYAACGNNDPDWYGSFHVSWEGGGTPTTRLKDWLDPNNTGMLTLDGRAQMFCTFFVEATPAYQELCADLGSYASSINISENFNGPVTLSIDGVPAGVTASFITNPVMPGGSTQLQINNINGLSSGTYTMTISGTDGTEMSTSTLTLVIYNGVPGLTNALFPMDGALDVGTKISLTWEAINNAQTYSYELATDLGFGNIISSGSQLPNNTIGLPELEAETPYFWHVRAENLCGSGAWSNTFSFETANISCQTLVPEDLPITISSMGTPTISSTIYYPNPGEILDINVIDLTGEHTYISDLIFELTSPEQTTITLLDTYCGSENDFFISFDDEADNTPIPCPYSDGGTYQPQDALSAFIGEDPQGEWTLTVYDVFNQDGGILQNWELEICTALSAFVNVDPISISGCADGVFTYTLTPSEGFTGPVTLEVFDNPPGSDVLISPNPVNPGQPATIQISANSASLGTYQMTLSATDGTNTIPTQVELTLVGAVAATNLLNPTDAETAVSINPIFSWTVVADANNYLFEISANPDFTNILETNVTATNSYSIQSDLDYDQVYFWRITAFGDCGAMTSLVFSFQTAFFKNTKEVAGIFYQLSPNPTSSLIQIEFSQPIQTDILVDVFSVDGRQLQSLSAFAGSTNIEIQLGQYAAGVYLLRLRSGEASKVERVLVIE